MAVTLEEVARHAGVSLATASRALNGSARAVTEELSARVRASADALGYLPNAPAQALARSSGSTIGVLLHDVADPYFGGIARAVGDAAARAGLLTMVTSTDGDPRRELEAIRMLHAHRARAIVLAGSAYNDPAAIRQLDDALEAYQKQGGRVAAISEHGSWYDTVDVTNRAGAASLTHSLAQLGHRRFAVITGPERLRVAEERLDGVLEALRELDLTLPEGLLQRAEFTREGGREAMARILDVARESGTPLPTTVIALSDICAAGVLAELRERGIAVPGEISVAGFDDIPLATDLAPALSTVRLPLASMGESAVRLALADPSPQPARVTAFAQVVLRDSTAAPSGS